MTRPTKKKSDDQELSEAVIMERMDEALKRMMNTPPETHKEMVERRKGGQGMRQTKAEKHGYKGIEYGVQSDGPGKWKWAFYPKIRSGMTVQRGKVSGSQEEAVAACKAAIEKALQKNALR